MKRGHILLISCFLVSPAILFLPTPLCFAQEAAACTPPAFTNPAGNLRIALVTDKKITYSVGDEVHFEAVLYNTVVLRRGSFGDAIAELQELLRAKGFDLSIDSDFGAATELAVMTFQKNNGLVEDGIVGRNTWTSLRS